MFFCLAIWCPMRGQKNNSVVQKRRTDTLVSPPLTVPDISYGRLLLSPQQWRSRALASSQGTRLLCYLCTWKCLWIQVRDCIRSATRAAVYYTTSEGAPTLKCESACYRPVFQRPWNNNGLWLERYPWVTLAAFHKVELFTVRWIKERVAGGASLFHMNGREEKVPLIHSRSAVYYVMCWECHEQELFIYQRKENVLALLWHYSFSYCSGLDEKIETSLVSVNIKFQP